MADDNSNANSGQQQQGQQQQGQQQGSQQQSGQQQGQQGQQGQGQAQSLLDTVNGQQGQQGQQQGQSQQQGQQQGEQLLAGKYKTPADLEKAYKELEGKLGEMGAKLKGFAGAPEKYDLSMPDDLKDQVEWNSDDPLLGEFTAFAKEVGMTQEVFTKCLHMLARYEYMQEVIDLQQEKAALGDRADERLAGFHRWAQANLSEEQLQVVMTALGQRSRPAQVFQALEAVLQATRQPSITQLGDDVRGSGPQNEAEWRAKWYAKSDMKGVQYKIDEPGMREKARQELAQIVGTGDHVQVVGKRKAG